MAKESISHNRTKHIKRRFNSIHDQIKEGDIEICKTHTDLNVADPLTKPLSRAKHDQHQDSMGVCRCFGNGGPQTCLPAACGVARVGAQCGPASSAQAQDARKGPSLVGRTTGGFLRSRLIRQAREEPVTQAMMIEIRRAPACAVSLFPLRCKGSKRRPRQPFRCNKTKTSRTAGWRSS